MKQIIGLSLLFALADQAIKALIRSRPEGTVFLTLPHWMEITHCRNTGAAFSLLAGHPQVVTLLTALLLLLMAAAVFRRLHLTYPARLAVSALLGGGLGNLADRLFFGAVTDYIRLLPIRFPVFNLADVLITLSVTMLMLLLLTGRLETPSGETHEQHP